MSEKEALCYLLGYLTARGNADEPIVLSPEEHGHLKQFLKLIINVKGAENE